LVLKVSSSEVASGDTANVHVTNVGDADFVYHFGGASNGCGAFQWKVVLTHEDQTRLSPEDPHRREVCTMQIIRPYDIVIKPGESHALSVDTSTPWWEYRALGTADVSPQLLKAGNYTVQVTGASGKNPLVGFEVLHATVRLGN